MHALAVLAAWLRDLVALAIVLTIAGGLVGVGVYVGSGLHIEPVERAAVAGSDLEAEG